MDVVIVARSIAGIVCVIMTMFTAYTAQMGKWKEFRILLGYWVIQMLAISFMDNHT